MMLDALKSRLRRHLRPVKPICTEPIIFCCGMSRSGTTLLATVLDSHSQICMGYEMEPRELPTVAEIRRLLDEGMQLSSGDFSTCGTELIRAGHREVGRWLARCDRSGATAGEVSKALEQFESQGEPVIATFWQTLRVASLISLATRDRLQAKISGFKVTHTFVEGIREACPNGIFLMIVRDPRDVVTSQIRHGFEATIDNICTRWNGQVEHFRRLQRWYPGQARLIRYEDFVSRPREIIPSMFEILPVEVEDGVYRFYQSDASVHGSGHPNAESLRRDFFTDGIGRWKQGLYSDERIRYIQRACGRNMQKMGYEVQPIAQPIRRAATSRNGALYSLPRHQIRSKRFSFACKRKFRESQYADMLGRFADTHQSITYADFVKIDDVGDRKLLIVRHDVDHDHLAAIRMAEWEHLRGLRTTYSLLHSAWYYGRLDKDRIIHTTDLVDCALHIQSLGHEVNLHNNLVVEALLHGVDPARLLEQEIEFFDRIGIKITGTSSHGDPLCHELTFRNFEFFRECCDPTRGGPRTLRYSNNGVQRELRLGEVSMFDFGLEYEAYEIQRDIWITESGGKLREGYHCRGKRPFGRHDPNRGEVVQILAHPIWWDFPKPC